MKVEASDVVLERLDATVEKGGMVLLTHTPNPPNVMGFPTLDTGQFAEWRTQCLTYLKHLFGGGHTYSVAFETDTDSGAYQGAVESGIGILRAAREDIGGGYLADVRALISAEVFSDFLEMAQHLFDTGYKDPAAMLAGAVLEDGLRRIGTMRGIKVKNRDDLSALNQKCADAALYNRLVQKGVQVWIDIRNHADHAEFDQYTDRDVEDMLRGVGVFLAERLA
jgi:hypothetical protein